MTMTVTDDDEDDVVDDDDDNDDNNDDNNTDNDIKNNAWVTVNNDFLVTNGVICQWCSRVTKSRVKISGKSPHDDDSS